MHDGIFGDQIDSLNSSGAMAMLAKILSTVFASLLLSGCWDSKGSLYADDVPLTPFAGGRIRSVDENGKATEHVLALQNGIYVIGGGAIHFRLYPLSGAPTEYLILDVTLQDCISASCRPESPNKLHYYGLAHITSAGIEELMYGDCFAEAAKALGAVRFDASGTCEFDNRGALEKALLTLTKSKPVAIIKPE